MAAAPKATHDCLAKSFGDSDGCGGHCTVDCGGRFCRPPTDCLVSCAGECVGPIQRLGLYARRWSRLLKLLFEQGADPRGVDAEMIDAARKQNDAEIVRLLQEARARQ